jgi:undecaprenyl-diphosphatase
VTANGLSLRPARHPFVLVIVGLCGIAVVAGFGFTVTHWVQWTTWETGALSAIADSRVPAGIVLAAFIAWLFAPAVATVLTLFLAIVIGMLSRSMTRAIVFAVVVAVCWSGSEMMKLLVQRPRPAVSVPVVGASTSFSFPSGHTAFACAIVIALLLTVRDWRFRWAAGLLGGALVLLVAWSRMYLGVHFPTDVTASVLLTASVAAVVIPLILNVALPVLGVTPRTAAERPSAEDAIHGGGE